MEEVKRMPLLGLGSGLQSFKLEGKYDCSMALKRRIHYPGALYHVIMRGNARQDIFFDDEDRYRFYLLVQEGVERFGHRDHAFCLMTNHI